MKCIRSKFNNIFTVGHHYGNKYLLGSCGTGNITKDNFGRIWLVKESENQYYIYSNDAIMAEFVNEA